jgi:hypothetical protein
VVLRATFEMARSIRVRVIPAGACPRSPPERRAFLARISVFYSSVVFDKDYCSQADV